MSHTQTKYDLSYRPQSYWSHDDPLQEILSGISGTARRAMITDFWEAGQFDQLENGLLEDELDVETRQRLGAFHPFFMGGEYLPERLPGEVPIVRIDLESTTFDVIELRARPFPGGKISLRWVDEYETEFDMPAELIEQPMSFGDLLNFIQDCGIDEMGKFPLVYNEMNYQGGSDVEDLRDFTSVSSDFYPELHPWAEGLFREWAYEKEQDAELVED